VRLVGSSEMREIDRTAIEGFGIPSLTLMDRAGRAVAEAAVQLAAPGGRFVVVCGGGNNGGDGFVAARLLRSAGRDARVLALVPAERLSPDARAVREQAQRAGVAIDDVGELAAVDAGVGDVVLDAIFGTGLARPPAGAFAGAIARIEAARVAGARVLAVDVPSGLSADTGRPLGACVRADRTVTFAFQKRGLVIYPGAAFAGEVTVADIGIPAEAARRVPVGCELLTEMEARVLVPPRAPDAHKGDAGRLLVVAGSPGKSGAAHLALTGALRGGVGLVTLAARGEVMALALAGRPEAMSAPIPGAGALARADLQALLALAKSADAIALGPGIPRGPETGELVRALLQRAGKPAVVDADGLNALAEAPAAIASIGVPLLLTPHPGEMARLCGTGIEAVQADRIGLAAAKAREWNATVVLKGARTVVADPQAPPTVIPCGNPGLATGGTGDVLAGLCGALLAGGLPPPAAGRAAAYVHGRAGDLAARRFGERGLVAGDLGEAIGAVWAEWRR
jgi:ADP-dependent NAD(P)H-hydrate dehydratase / NAD(P)H-hydrate epimerase